MSRILHLTLIGLLGFAFAISCGPSPAATPTVTPPPQPSADPLDADFPEGTAIFVVDRSLSGARYRIDETFFENATIETGNIGPGRIQAVGNTPGLTGFLAIDLESDPPKVLGGTFVADLSLLRTNKERRDERLRSQWLQTYVYPNATLVLDPQEILSESYTAGEETTFVLTGELTVRTVTIPVEFVTTATLDEAETEIQATADADLLLTDLEIDPPAIPRIVEVDNPFQIGAILVATRQE